MEKVNERLGDKGFLPGGRKVPPMLGQFFSTRNIKSQNVVVIATSLTAAATQRGPSANQQDLSVNQRQCTVVGIMPKSFQFPTEAELWMPPESVRVHRRAITRKHPLG